MALTLRKPRALTIFMQTCIVMLIFCFTECAAGNFCRSHGHTCWGAHGKRSDIQERAPTMRVLTTKTLLNGYPQNGIMPASKTQWILSRLITGQPVLPLTDKYHVRWGDFLKDESYTPPKWNHDTAPMSDESIESIRIPINNENEGNEKKISNTQGIIRSMNEKLENNPEILLISPDEYDKPVNDPQKLDILKFLNEGNGDMK